MNTLRKHIAFEQPHLLRLDRKDRCLACDKPVQTKDADLCGSCQADADEYARERMADVESIYPDENDRRSQHE